MFETVVGVATVIGVVIAAAEFMMKWFRKPPSSGSSKWSMHPDA